MKEYTNFYETVEEVRMRLRDTVILYDGKPYYVLNVANHKNDGVFRLYLDPLRDDLPVYSQYEGGVPYSWGNGDDPVVYASNMDDWMEKNPKSGIIRKKMNSPLFNKFRPFPLGMCNWREKVVYLARSPSRSTSQGLTGAGMKCFSIGLGETSNSNRSGPSLIDPEVYNTILGIYPDPDECLKNLLDKTCSNTGVGFHREFALLRGPLDLMFLVYKAEVIGLLLENNFSRVRISGDFKHLREVVDELNLFNDIV